MSEQSTNGADSELSTQHTDERTDENTTENLDNTLYSVTQANCEFGYATSIYGKRERVKGVRQFMQLYTHHVASGSFYESINSLQPVVMFVDIESKTHTVESTVIDLKTILKRIFKKQELRFIVTDASGYGKFSKHLVVRIYDGVNEYVFDNTDLLCEFVKRNLNIDCVDLSVYKSGGYLWRCYGSMKEKSNRRLELDTLTESSSPVVLLDHFIQWPGNSGVSVSEIMDQLDQANNTSEKASNAGLKTTAAEISVPDTNVSNYIGSAQQLTPTDIFLRIFEEFGFSVRSVCNARETISALGLYTLYVNCNYEGACPNGVIHKSNKTYIKIDIAITCLSCHGCRIHKQNVVRELRTKEILSPIELFVLFKGNEKETELLHETSQLFKSKDPEAGVVQYDQQNERLVAEIGMKDNLFTSDVAEHRRSIVTLHALNKQGYRATTSDNHEYIEFKADKTINKVTTHFKRYSINFLEQRIFNNCIFVDKSIAITNNFILPLNSDQAYIQTELGKMDCIELIYETSTLSTIRLSEQLTDSKSFLRDFLITPSPVKFAGFVKGLISKRCLVSKKQWYLADSANVYKKISEETVFGIVTHFAVCLVNALKECNMIFSDTIPDSQDGDNSLYKLFIRAQSRLEDPGWARSTVTVLYPYLRRDGVDQLIDKKLDILPFSDGCYDYNTQTFRKIELSDYVSISLKYDIETLKFKGDTELTLKFLNNMFNENEEVDYVLNTLRKMIFDSVNDKLYFFIGNGSNGKTTFFKILRHGISEFMKVVPPGALNTSRNEGCNPYLAGLAKIRIATVTEVSDKTFDIDLLKRLAGSEVISVRSLYSEPVEFEFITKMVFVANDLPKFSSTVDAALERRMEYIHFAINLRNPNNIKNVIDLEDAKTIDSISYGLVLLIISKKHDKTMKTPRSFKKYSSYAIEELRHFYHFMLTHLERDKESYLSFFEVYCHYNGEQPEFTNKDVSKKPDYSLKLKEFKAFVRETFNVSEVFTRNREGKNIRVFKGIKCKNREEQ